MDLDDYLAVLEGRGERLGDVELRRGQFHDVVLTGSAAYRFPRGEQARRLLPERRAVLSVLAEQRLGFATPVPGAAVHDDEPVGRCFLASSRVPGRPFAAVSGEAYPDSAVGAELGRVLTALAGATARLAPVLDGVGAEGDRWAAFAAGVEEDLFPLMSARGRDRARRELAAVLALPAPAAPGLVHSDLGGDNVLWSAGPSLRVVGVIDWDGLCVGSPANDVASIAATYGWSVAARAAQGLADAGTVLEQAHAIKATFALQQALPARRGGDTAHLDDGLRTYR